MSNKGGHRSTTWSNTWKHGRTRVIRVPEVLADEIMEYARRLDGGDCLVTGNAAKTQEAIDRYIEIRRKSYRPNQHSQKPDVTSRAWDELRKFKKLLVENPRSLGFEE